MPKKYKLKQTLLMPGMMPIILPVGYEVSLKGERYLGEGGWIFHPHGVEDNKYHWEEIKEKERTIVLGLSFECHNQFNGGDYILALSKTIPHGDYRAKISKAIESILNDEPIEGVKGGYVKVGEWTKEDEELVAKIVKNPVYTGSHYAENQPLSGELITKEECERRVEVAEKKAFGQARRVVSVEDNHINFFYKNVHAYKTNTPK